eukprot:TRINITY_DN1807_c0_g1_i2.p1 TRINITY_DN1807_c0_g1~~TRINITY_DN1807_c0_g1_i2.p1  ORF type:complete len:130 (+),score=45.79 TRINITY_DN1807_c0_g1_i2:61-450(+)
MAPTMHRFLTALALSLTAGTSLAAETFLGPVTDLHADMKSMMDDDGMDDVSDDDPTQPRDSAGLLQKSADAETEMYMQDSSNALTNALGSRWNGQELEANAKKQTTALLKGIAGHQDLGQLMGAMAAIR